MPGIWNPIQPRWWFVVLGALLIGCNSRHQIAYIDFLPLRSTPGFVIDMDQSRAALREHAGKLGGFSVRLDSRNDNAWQLTVQVELVTERPADQRPEWVRRGLGLSGELNTLDRQQRYVAEVLKVEVMPATSGSEPLVASAIDALITRLNRSIRLAKADEPFLVKTLLEGDAHARAEVVRVARQRKLVGLAPQLVARLKDDTTPLQEAIRLSSALVEFGIKASAGAIIDAISRHPSATVPLVFLLGQLGGKEAEAYLFTVQSGHPDPKVQAAAKEALASPP